MGKALHRAGQILGGIIISALGFGFDYSRLWIDAMLPLSDQTPINIPQILVYASWVLYAVGGLLILIGGIGLLLLLINRMRGGNEEAVSEQPPSRQPAEQTQDRRQGETNRPRQQPNQRPRQRPQDDRE